ncbi:UNVERIFIED_CONTAM: E3 ubiquitin-protein ligase CHIP, partial [Sesamum radiatum]
AVDLGRGANPKGYMVEEIWQELAKAKYLLWEHESTRRSWELQNLKQLEALDRVFNKAAEDDSPTEVSIHPHIFK